VKKFLVLACGVAALASAPAAFSYFTVDNLPPTWHIHNGGTCSQCAAVPAFFVKALDDGDLAAYLADPAECPDATDKVFLGGGEPNILNTGINPNQPLRAGICETSTQILHLRSIDAGDPAPAGWTFVSTSGGYSTYYLVTTK
jgi:hypothetical protein